MSAVTAELLQNLSLCAMPVEFTYRRPESSRGGVQEGRGKDSRLWPKDGHGFQHSQVCTLRCCTCIHSHTHQYNLTAILSTPQLQH